MVHASFGALVRRRRRALGLTQHDLALQVGCSAVTIRKIESDERRASAQMAERLARYLEIEPAERDAFLRLARVVAPEPPVSLGPGNLPARPPALVGRDELLISLRNRLLRDELRLLTLTGPGGVGKTSLALRLAAAAAAEFPAGVFVVELAALSHAEDVADAVVVTLGLSAPGQRPALELLGEALGEGRVLLLLDNMEQIAGAAQAVAGLLAACPGLTVLATSRTALRAPGEQVALVPPLDLTAAGREGDTLGAPAVALFVERARAARRDVQAEDAATISAICGRLDGLPLAIELVAARSGVLEPHELLRRLDSPDGYGLLQISGPAAHEPRHRSLDLAIDWSARLLPEHHWLLFVQLGVFAGGFELEAAEALGAGIGLAPVELLDGVQELVAASLLTRQTTAGGATRFAMLQTIHEYALSRLAASGLEAEARRRHAAYLLGMAEAADTEADPAEQLRWFERLEREHDNLRAALAWALRAELATAAGLGHHLWWFWLSRGHWREGQQWLEAVLTRADAGEVELEPAIVADLCKGSATIAKERGDFATAERRYQQGLNLARALDNPRWLATTLNNYGGMLHRQADFARALACYEEALALLRMLDLPLLVALMCGNLAALHQEFGQYERALPYQEEGLRLMRELDSPGGLAGALANRGEFGILTGDLELARASYEEALALYEASADERGQVIVWNGLGMAAFRRGDHVAALRYQQQALPVCQRYGDFSFLILALEGAAHSAGARGELQAARLYGAAEALRERMRMPRPPSYAAIYDGALAAAAARHPARTWAATLRHGRTLSAAEAVAIALSLE